MTGQASRRLPELALVLSALMSSVTVVAADSVTRGPYLQLGSDTSVVVRWRTDVPTDSRVSYGTVDCLGSSVSDSKLLTNGLYDSDCSVVVQLQKKLLIRISWIIFFIE